MAKFLAQRARLAFRWQDVASLLARTGRVPPGATLTRAEASADGRHLLLTLDSPAFPLTLADVPRDLPVDPWVCEHAGGI